MTETQLAELAEHYQAIGEELTGNLPRGWRQVTSRLEWNEDGTEWMGRYTAADGSEGNLPADHLLLEELFGDLRQGMDRVGSGGWKVSLIQITADGTFSAEFEYEDPTRWDPSELRFMDRLDPDGRLSRKQRNKMLDAYGAVVDNGGAQDDGIEAARQVMARFKR